MQDFKKLDHEYLKKYARRWRKKYSHVPIKKIVLYEYYPEPKSKLASESRDDFKNRNPNSKEPRYVVVFRVLGLDIQYYRQEWRLYIEGRRPYIPDSKVDLPWRDFIYKMDNISIATIPQKSYFIYNFNGFEDVYAPEYKQTARENFHQDWCFEAYSPEDSLPDHVDDKVSMVLWDTENKIVEDIRPSAEPYLNPFSEEINEKWISCGKLLDKGLKGFELFRLFEQDRLHPQDPDNGFKIIDPSTVEKKPAKSYEDILEEEKAVNLRGGDAGPIKIGRYKTISFKAGEHELERPFTMSIVETIAKERYNNLPKIRKLPAGCRAKTFSLSENPKYSLGQINEARAWLVRHQEVMEIEGDKGIT